MKTKCRIFSNPAGIEGDSIEVVMLGLGVNEGDGDNVGVTVMLLDVDLGTQAARANPATRKKKIITTLFNLRPIIFCTPNEFHANRRFCGEYSVPLFYCKTQKIQIGGGHSQT